MSQDTQFIIALASLVVFGFVGGNAIIFLYYNIKQNILDILIKRQMNKEYKERTLEKDKMKTDGDFHDWITMVVGAKELTVCRKTGWCPSNESFIQMWYIKNHEENLKREEEYAKFKKERTVDISKKYGITFLEAEEIVNQIFEIKKDFAVKKLADLQDELTDKGKSNNDSKTI